MTTPELTEKINELYELRSILRELTAEVHRTERAIAGELRMRKTEKIKTDCYTVRLKKSIAFEFDSTEFETAMPQLYKRFSTPVKENRIQISKNIFAGA